MQDLFFGVAGLVGGLISSIIFWVMYIAKIKNDTEVAKLEIVRIEAKLREYEIEFRSNQKSISNQVNSLEKDILEQLRKKSQEVIELKADFRVLAHEIRNNMQSMGLFSHLKRATQEEP